MALFFYRLFFLLISPILLLALLVRSVNHKAYRQRLSERLGFAPNTLTPNTTLVHAASVGEVIAIKAFVETLLSTGQAVTVTTFTPTGSAQVEKQFGDRVQHCYLPLDIWPSTALFLKRLQPAAFVIMETELWPNIISQCKHKNIPLLLINGRLSDNSMKSYGKIQRLITPTLNQIDHILCQSQHNHDNFIKIGATPEQCKVSGNLKFDISTSPEILAKAQQLATLLPKNKSVWLVASTHLGDEELLLSTYAQLSTRYPELLLIIVPRHPERFEQVFTLCQQQGMRVQKRSSNEQVKPDTQVWILDTLGELMSGYQLADMVTIGGTFSSIGGHNPLEPALFKKPTIVGHDMRNFKEIHSQLNAEEGLITLKADDEIDQLCRQLSQLMELPQLGKKLGDNAYKVVLANQGASKKSVDVLLKLLVTK